jgi:[ribosomal protein S5]-alanine N-acetyltransferase
VVTADAQFLCRLLNEPSWLQNIGDRGVRTLPDAERYIQDKFNGSYESLGFAQEGECRVPSTDELVILCGAVV